MNPLTKPKEHLTTYELADRWSISVGTLENWRGQGKGPPYIKLGKSKGAAVIYPMAGILEFEKKHTRNGGKS